MLRRESHATGTTTQGRTCEWCVIYSTAPQVGWTAHNTSGDANVCAKELIYHSCKWDWQRDYIHEHIKQSVAMAKGDYLKFDNGMLLWWNSIIIERAWVLCLSTLSDVLRVEYEATRMAQAALFRWILASRVFGSTVSPEYTNRTNGKFSASATHQFIGIVVEVMEVPWLSCQV